jgi:hypothetical protein
MKTHNYTILLAAVLSFAACDEIPPAVDMTVPTLDLLDTTYMAPIATPDPKVVVVEEFTGVRCVPCVDGHIKIEELLTKYGKENLAVVSIHSGGFAIPKPGHSKEDYFTQKGEEIRVWHAVGQYPSSVIDRKIFAGQTGLRLSKSLWDPSIAEQLLVTPKVNVKVTPSIVSPAVGIEHLVARVEVQFLETITDPVRITVMVKESHIIDYQATLAGDDDDYLHEHVLRGIMTPSNGTTITAGSEAGRVVIREFAIENMPPHWKTEDMEVIAFVHQAGSDKLVLQGARAEVQ